ncbi:MAG: hypothetical protein IJ012_05265 [Clostridia bacterium]|nr:hypothetical protein [Clostridia bacterium]
MKTKQLFLRAYEVCPMEEREFLNYLGDCLRALLARYPTSLLAARGDGEIKIPTAMDEECGLDELYSGALLQGVVAGATGDASDRAAFLEEADYAYRNLWRRAAKGARAMGR